MSEGSESTAKKDLPETQGKVKALKEQLAALHLKKEEAFQKKEAISTKIKTLLGSVKTSKSARDSLTSTVHEEKRKRRELNAQIRKKIEAIKELNKNLPKKEEVPASRGSYDPRDRRGKKDSPGFLKKKIEELETAIETGAISFTKEKQYMKEIKVMKKELEGLKETSQIWKDRRALSKEIDALKKEANALHKGIRQRADTSQEKHEALVSVSKNLDTLRKQEKEAYESFLVLKKEYLALNGELKSILGDVQIAQHKVKAKKEAKQKKRDEQMKKDLEERKLEVTEKLKKGAGVKLTMEDLLAFQSDKKD